MTTDIAKLRELTNAATPGPWKASNSHGSCVVAWNGAHSEMIADLSPDSSERGWEGRAEDAAFIAAARSALPALIDKCEAAEARQVELDVFYAAMYALSEGTPLDVASRLTKDRDRLAAECARLRALVGELADIATLIDGRPELRDDGMVEKDHRGRAMMRARITAIRAEAKGEV